MRASQPLRTKFRVWSGAYARMPDNSGAPSFASWPDEHDDIAPATVPR